MSKPKEHDELIRSIDVKLHKMDEKLDITNARLKSVQSILAEIRLIELHVAASKKGV
jgi:hypothetical protein